MADVRKIVQSLCYIGGKCRGRSIDKIYALKIIYMADRYHLRKYGSTITGDEYFAMKKGPVASITKTVIEGKVDDEPLAEFVLCYIMPGRNRFQSKIATCFDELAKTDIEALDVAYDTFIDKGPENIIQFTHRFPEWQKHQIAIDRGRKRVKMNLVDFFEPSLFPKDEYCPAGKEQVELNREIYLDTPECLRA